MSMAGKLYVDSIDAFTQWGVFVEKGGYKGVVGVPSFKALQSTSWPESDGEEWDLSAPVLDGRSLQVPFCITDVSLWGGFLGHLQNGAYHVFDFREVGRALRLRLVDNSAFSSLVRVGGFTLTFYDDFPILPEGDPLPDGGSVVRQNGFLLDGVDFSKYGCWVLAGAEDSVRKAAKVKEALKISPKAVVGLIYDGQKVSYATKELSLDLLFNMGSLTSFWNCWNAFFSALLKPGERTLSFPFVDAALGGFYKSCQVQRFELNKNGGVWCEAKVSFTLTSQRISGGS